MTTSEMPSGVWPGVSMTRNTTSPTFSSSPSLTALCGKVAPARAPKTTSAPVRSASSLCPLTKSACRCVSTTYLIFSPRRFGLRDVLVHVALRIDDRRLARGADQVRGVREAAEVELFEVHFA